MGPDEFTRLEMHEGEDEDGGLRVSLTDELDLVGVNQLSARPRELRGGSRT